MSYFSPVHMQALDYVFSKTSPAAVIMEKICLVTFTLSLQWHATHLSTATLLLLPMAHRLPPDDASFPFVSHPASFPPWSFFNTVYTTIIQNHRRNHSHRRPGTCHALRGAYNCVFFPIFLAGRRILTSHVHTHYCT